MAHWITFQRTYAKNYHSLYFNLKQMVEAGSRKLDKRNMENEFVETFQSQSGQ